MKTARNLKFLLAFVAINLGGFGVGWLVADFAPVSVFLIAGCVAGWWLLSLIKAWREGDEPPPGAYPVPTPLPRGASSMPAPRVTTTRGDGRSLVRKEYPDGSALEYLEDSPEPVVTAATLALLGEASAPIDHPAPVDHAPAPSFDHGPVDHTAPSFDHGSSSVDHSSSFDSGSGSGSGGDW